MRTEKEIKEELKNRENSMKNLHFLFEQTKNPEFEGRSIESKIITETLKWVLGKDVFTEETLIMNTQTGELE